MIVVPVQQVRVTTVAPRRVQRGLLLLEGPIPAEVFRSRVWMPRGSNLFYQAPVTIPSNPASFYERDETLVNTVVNSVTFAIPGGHWTAGEWSVAHTVSGVAGMNAALNIATTSATVVTSPTHNLNGNYTDLATASTGVGSQMTDINAAAGGNLTVGITLNAGSVNFSFQDFVDAFTLSLS